MKRTYRLLACVASGLLGMAGQSQAGSFGGFGGGAPMIGYGSSGGFGAYRSPEISPATVRDNRATVPPYSQERVDWLRQQVSLHMQGCGCALCQELRADTAS
ncbi:hypothetical protein OL229_20595 [Neisseriaceae bacterium JH1-16]|nr:hypothetical protein [Neisseriaceae bacterium JH1-16]